MTLVRTGSLLLLASGLLVSFGCSRGGPETIPVFGKVTFEGREPPEACRVFFRPVEGAAAARPAVAQAERDGAYEAKAFKDAEGLLPGSYSLNVSYIDIKPGTDPTIESNWITQNFDAGELVVSADADEVQYDITVPAK